MARPRGNAHSLKRVRIRGTLRVHGRRLAAALVVSAVVTGCADVDPGAQKRVRSAAGELAGTTVDGTFSMTFQVAGDTFTMEGDMVMDVAARIGRMTIRMRGVQDVPAGAELDMLIDGDDTYFRDPELYGTSRWVHVSSEEAGIGNGLGTGPDLPAYLAYLSSARNVRIVGIERVAGASTTHYEGDVDPSQLNQMDASFDVWIDVHGAVHRIDLAFEPHEGDGGSQVRLNVGKIGVELDVEVPSGREVVDLQDLEPPQE